MDKFMVKIRFTLSLLMIVFAISIIACGDGSVAEKPKPVVPTVETTFAPTKDPTIVPLLPVLFPHWNGEQLITPDSKPVYSKCCHDCYDIFAPCYNKSRGAVSCVAARDQCYDQCWGHCKRSLISPKVNRFSLRATIFCMTLTVLWAGSMKPSLVQCLK